MKFWIWLCLAGLLTGTFCASARAATSAAVLGVRAIDGDTELEKRLSLALREAVAGLGEFEVSDRELGLEQMLLAHSCDEPNASCLAEIARTLNVERLFYGTVQLTERGYELSISAFDSRKGSVEVGTLRQVAAEQLASSGAAKATTSKLVQRLTGRITTGYIIVTANSDHAEVQVDGIRRGALDEAGVFTIELPTGEHMIRVVPRGDGLSEERAVRIKPSESTRLNIEFASDTADDGVAATPQPELEETPARSSSGSRRSLRKIFGWVSVGIGAALAGATLYSWVRLRQIADDGDYKAYRRAYPPRGSEGGVANVCLEAGRKTLARMDPSQASLERSASKLCDEADMLEVAQYVLLGGTIVAGGVGTYLLVTSRPRAAGEVSLRPRFDGQTALLEASAAF